MKKSIIIVLVLFLSFATGYAGNLLIDNVSLKPGETVDLKISLSSVVGNYVGIQFDLTLPDGFSLENGDDGNVYKLSANQANDITVNVQDLGSGTNRFVFYSNSLQLLKKGDFLTFHLKASSTLPLGNYTISVDEIVYSDLDGTITKESKVNATATVTGTESIIVTVKNIAREYADANPSFEYTVEGGELVGVPEITCEATEASPVGTYDIVVTKGSVTNPNVTFINGTLAITKAPLTIKAGTYTRKEDEENPEFTLEYVGFKRNETEAVLTKKPVVNTKAKNGSPVGEYDVTVSGAEAQNYDISYVNGKLTITEADPVTITAKSYEIEYGDDIPEFEYISEGAELNGTPSITCEATKTSPAGTYPIVITKGSVKNFNDTYVNGTLTIKKVPLKITAKDYTIKQGETLPTFEATYEGFKNDETSEVLTKQPVFTTTATSTSTPGEYEITVSGAEAQNYNISYVNGKLTIEKSDFIPGDVNGDGLVNVTDIVATVNFIMEKPSDNFNKEAADLNGDGEVNVTDIVKMVTIIMDASAREMAE